MRDKSRRIVLTVDEDQTVQQVASRLRSLGVDNVQPLEEIRCILGDWRGPLEEVRQVKGVQSAEEERTGYQPLG